MALRNALLFAFVTLSTACATAQEGDKPAAKPEEAPVKVLCVGDKAPPLAIESWVKGTPVNSFALGQVYLIDFWATWCGPCIASMPHLTELQKKYQDKGLTVIGLTSTDSRGNSLDLVEAMVKKKNEEMGYTVAWDKVRQTNSAYMKAAQRNTIPSVFLIDQKGLIAYIGHPKDIDDVLEQVIAQKHDMAALAAAYKTQVKMAALQATYSEAFKKADWETVLATADQMLALDPERSGMLAAMKFRIYAREKGDCETGYTFVNTYFDGAGKNDWKWMTVVAWEIVDPLSKITRRDLDLALKLSERSNELAKGEQAPVLDTMARVYYMRGDLAKAVEIETKAAQLDKGLERKLEEYKSELARK